MTQIIAKLVVDAADAAIAFYQRALQAELAVRYAAADGTVVYASMRIGDAAFELKDADATDRSPSAFGGSPVILTLEVEDADQAAAGLLGAGAEEVFTVNDMPYGYRQGRVQDPFGYQWILSQRTEDLSPEEVQARLRDAGF